MYICQVDLLAFAQMATETIRRRSPRGEGDRLRDRLLEAAVEVIADTGDVTKVSVRTITKRAGVSPTALYLHFPDRDAIVDAAIDAGFSVFNAAIIDARESAEEPWDRLRAMGEAYLAFAEQRPELYSVIFTARRPAAEETLHAVNRSAGFEALVAAVTDCGSSDPAGAAVALWSALHGYAMLGACGPIGKTFEPPAAFVVRVGTALVA